MDSTWRAIHEYLTVSHPDKLPEFLRKWGVNDDYNGECTNRDLIFKASALILT